jgi:hypothetical protein
MLMRYDVFITMLENFFNLYSSQVKSFAFKQDGIIVSESQLHSSS